MSKRKKNTYDDKFRASAVIMLEAQGYPDKKGALASVSKHLGVAPSTLHGWFNKISNPPPSEIRNEKEIDFKEAIRKEMSDILGILPNKRDEASYKDLTTSLAILLDKLQLLENKPTQINENRHSGDVKLTVSERNQRLSEILESARTRRDRLSTDDSNSTNIH